MIRTYFDLPRIVGIVETNSFADFIQLLYCFHLRFILQPDELDASD